MKESKQMHMGRWNRIRGEWGKNEPVGKLTSVQYLGNPYTLIIMWSFILEAPSISASFWTEEAHWRAEKHPFSF